MSRLFSFAFLRPPPPAHAFDILAFIASEAPSHGVALAALAATASMLVSGAVGVPKLRAGPARLAAVVPLLAALCVLPLCLPPSVVLRGTAAFVAWLAAMKLVALACGRGALALPGLSDAQRALLLLLPVTPLTPPPHGSKGPFAPATTAWRSTALALLHALGLAVFVVVLREDARAATTGSSGSSSSSIGGGGGAIPRLLKAAWLPMPPIVRHASYAAVVYLAVALILDGATPLALGWAFGGDGAGPPLAPSMRAPWGARSLAAFWSFHYNTAVSDALRHAAFAPVAQGSLVAAKRHHAAAAAGRRAVSPLRRAAGLTLVFFVSGLAHEVIVNGYMCGAALEQQRAAAAAKAGAAGAAGRSPGPRPGLMLCFFLAQVPALLLEQAVRERWASFASSRKAEARAAAAAAAARQPAAGAAAAALASRAARAALTLLALLLMTHVGFFPAMEACGVDRAGIDEVGAAVDAVAAGARRWWPKGGGA
jgi:hypothetical protein